jgi:flagellar hook-associated protein 2
MSSPVTMSGFNNIDFNSILNAVMSQEQAPLNELQARQQALQGQSSSYQTLATKLGAVETALADLKGSTALGDASVTNTDTSAVAVDMQSGAPVGTYDIVVQELARAQVMGTTSRTADHDTTTVATGGSMTIGGVQVQINGAVTLDGLAAAINSTDGIGVQASVVSPAAGSYQLVLTGLDTGTAHRFTVSTALTGGPGVTFANHSGTVSGSNDLDNATNATDARVVVNNITITSATNTIENALPGGTLTVMKKDTSSGSSPVTVTVGRDLSAGQSRIDTFVSAFNDLADFVDSQSTAAVKGDTSSIARDGLLRGLQTSLRTALTRSYGTGGQFKSAAEIGLGFTRTGKLTLDASVFTTATDASVADVQKLLSGSTGMFASLAASVHTYTQAGGLIPDATKRINAQVSSLSTRINDLSDRLAIRKAALQQEYTAADLTISQLNGQSGSLSSMGSAYRLF